MYKAFFQIMCRQYCTKTKHPRQVFSAIQPTGKPHLGNYLGALKKWVDFQNSETHPVIYAIADLHSITLPKNPVELQQNIFTMAASVMACGIDTGKSIFFQQSVIPQHSELCWILGTITSMAKISHLPQYKEKSQLVKEVPVGIFLYPILQAADIMLYRTTHVPVGEDQSQQIQLAHHLIRTFNNNFATDFPIPNTIIDTSYGRIKSLSDPIKKMSKSDISQLASITLLDEPDAILKKIKKAVTDFKSEVTYNPLERPGVSNLISIHSGLTGKTPDQIVKESIGLNTGQYKLLLAEIAIEHLNPIREKIIQYLNSKEFLLSELEKGAEKASEIAEKTIKIIKKQVGFDIAKSDATQKKTFKKAAS